MEDKHYLNPRWVASGDVVGFYFYARVRRLIDDIIDKSTGENRFAEIMARFDKMFFEKNKALYDSDRVRYNTRYTIEFSKYCKMFYAEKAR